MSRRQGVAGLAGLSVLKTHKSSSGLPDNAPQDTEIVPRIHAGARERLEPSVEEGDLVSQEESTV